MSRNLDGDGFRRTEEWTDHMISSFNPVALWDDYGIVADVIVRHRSPVHVSMPQY
jgi:hypothetical protein